MQNLLIELASWYYTVHAIPRILCWYFNTTILTGCSLKDNIVT